jgi:transposase InsO family protein
MPWKTQDIMSLREEFVLLARQEHVNRRELCRRFGISPQTAYKWLQRFAEKGSAGLTDRSRRPLSSPRASAVQVQDAVVTLRIQHPAWGGRKISRRLRDLNLAQVAPSTVTSILHRYELISTDASERATPWQRFEREAPNALWQVDFKGYFETPEGRCSPLTMLDDHSRFNVALHACGDTTTGVVQTQMERVFRLYGLPVQINFDNGAPWGAPSSPGQLTELGVWLVRLGVHVSHSRPYHPQTNGKDERFHRSLKAEVLNGRSFESLARVQTALDHWRAIYNHERPHEALKMATPISRYQPSARLFPEHLTAIEYAAHDEVSCVGWDGILRFRGRRYKLSNALHRQDVAVRARDGEDGMFDVFFAHHHCLAIDLRQQDMS